MSLDSIDFLGSEPFMTVFSLFTGTLLLSEVLARLSKLDVNDESLSHLVNFFCDRTKDIKCVQFRTATTVLSKPKFQI